MQAAAVRWGFRPTTSASSPATAASIRMPASWSSSRRFCSTACCTPRAFDFSNVSAVVMDEFHNFADPERGIVWELSLGLLPPHIRLLLAVGDGRQRVRVHRSG